MNLHEIKTALLSDHGINLTELQAKAVELSEKVRAKDAEIATLQADKTNLTHRVELSEKAAEQVKFDALVKRGMDDGKLTKAFADGSFKKVFDAQGYAFAEQMLVDMPKVVPVGDSKGNTPTGGDKQKFSDAGVELNQKAMELARTDKINLSEAIDRVMKSEPDLAKRYADLGST